MSNLHKYTAVTTAVRTRVDRDNRSGGTRSFQRRDANISKIFDYLNRAKEHRKAGQVDLAISDYTSAIDLDPDNPKAAPSYLERARLLKEKGLIDEALADCTKAIDLNPNNPRAIPTYLERARLRKDKGLIDEAIADCDQAIKLNPEDPRNSRAYTERAGLHIKYCDFNRALDDYNKAIGLAPEDPRNSGAYTQRAYLYAEYGYFDKALEDAINAERIVSVQEDRFYRLNGLIKTTLVKAHIYTEYKTAPDFIGQATEHYERALSYIERLLELAKNSPSEYDECKIYQSAAHVYNKKGNFHQGNYQFEDALICYQRAEKFGASGGNDNVGIYMNMGHLFRKWGQDNNAYENALKFYKKAANNNQNISSHINLGNLHRQYGFFGLALEEYNKAIDSVPENSIKTGGAYNGRAFLYREMGKFEEAEQDYKKAIEVNNHGKKHVAFSSFVHLGNLYKGVDASDGFDKAIAEYNKAINLVGEKHPKAAAAYVSLGAAYREKAATYRMENNDTEAKRYFEMAEKAIGQAITLNPLGSEAYASIGLLYLDISDNLQKDFAKIKKYFDEAKRLNPRHPDLYVHIGELFCRVKRFDEAASEFNEAINLVKFHGKKTFQWIYLEICLKFIEAEQFDLAEKYLEPAFPEVAILKRPVSTEDTLDVQRKKEWSEYIKLATENFESKQREKQTRDRLIQSFAHTLASSLVQQKKAIEGCIRMNDYSSLPRLLSELDRVEKNLHLLSISARDVKKLKAEFIESVSDNGVTLKNIFLRSLLSVVDTILTDKEYYEFVYKRFLRHIATKHQEQFSRLKTIEKDRLLDVWKKAQYYDDEHQRLRIENMTFEMLESEPATRQSVFDKWLKEHISRQYEEITKKQNLDLECLISWISGIFFRINYIDDGSSICFSSASNTGALYFFWFFNELILNTFKYTEAGTDVSVKVSDEFSYEIVWENKPTVQLVKAPGSRAGLDVLKIMARNLDGDLYHVERTGLFTVNISIPMEKRGRIS